jgi:hypothetical protein
VKRLAADGFKRSKERSDADPKKAFIKAAMVRGIRVALQGTKLATNAGINIGTFDLPFDTIADAVFAALDAAVFVGTTLKRVFDVFIASDAKQLFTVLTSFSGGPEAVAAGIDTVLRKLAAESERGAAAVTALVDKLVGVWDTLVEGAAPLVASLLAVVVPSDFGVARVLCENFILGAKKLLLSSGGVFRPFDVLAGLFNALPNIAREFLMSKQRIGDMLRGFVHLARKLLPAPQASLTKRLGAAVARNAVGTAILAPLVVVGAVVFMPIVPIIAAGAAVATAGNVAIALSPAVSNAVTTIIDEQVEPRVDILADAMQTCMALVYGLLYVMQTRGSAALTPPTPSKETPTPTPTTATPAK